MSMGLDELSKELNISESGLRKRIRTLGVPVEKGVRGKWLLSEELVAALKQADLAMKGGAGETTIRRIIGFAPDQPSTGHSALRTNEDTSDKPASDQVFMRHTEDKTPVPWNIDPELRAPHSALSTAHSGPQESGEGKGIQQVLTMLTEAQFRIDELHREKAEALRELADTKALVGTFQERSSNLKTRVEALEGEVKLLKAPPETRKPWWQFW